MVLDFPASCPDVRLTAMVDCEFSGTWFTFFNELFHLHRVGHVQRRGRSIGQLLLQDAQAGDGSDAQVQVICERLGVLGTDGRAPAWASK